MNDVNGLGPGFGGTLAAPIWHDYMSKASDGYCGDFAPPTHPWQGTAFFGQLRVDRQLEQSGRARRRQRQRRPERNGSRRHRHEHQPATNPNLNPQPPQGGTGTGTGRRGHGQAAAGFGTGHTQGTGGVGVHHQRPAPPGCWYGFHSAAPLSAACAPPKPDRRMPKEEKVELEGEVVEALPNAMFRVKLDNDHVVLGHVAGKMRRFRIRILPGDRVRVRALAVRPRPRADRLPPPLDRGGAHPRHAACVSSS